MNLYQKPKTCLGKYKINEIAYLPIPNRRDPYGDYHRNYRAVATRFGILISFCDAGTGEELCLLQSHKDEVLSIACSSDGKMIASGNVGKTIQLWESEQLKHTLEGHSDAVTSVVFSPDGKTLASGSKDSTIRLWDTDSGDHESTLEHSGVTSVIFSPDGEMLVSGSNDGTIRLWESETRFGQNRCITTFHSGTDGTSAIFTDNKSEIAVTSVVFSPDSSMLASGHDNGTVHLWNMGTLKSKSRGILEKHTGSIKSLDFSSDGRTLASGSKDKTICIWDTQTGQHLETLQKHTDTVFSVVFRDNQLISESSDGSIRFWSTKTGENNTTLVSGYTSNIESVVFSPNGQMLASISWSSRLEYTLIYLWDVSTGEMKTPIIGNIGNLESVYFSPDSKTLATVEIKEERGAYGRTTNSKAIRFWDISTGEQKAFPTEIETFKSVQFSPDNKTFVGVTASKICFWDIETWKPKEALLAKRNANVESIAFSRDSRRLLSVSTNEVNDTAYSNTQESKTSMFCFWDVETGEPISPPPKEMTDNIESVTFNPDKTKFATVHSDNLIRLWDIDTGKHQSTFEGAQEDIISVAFSLDNCTLACASRNGMILLWDITK